MIVGVLWGVVSVGGLVGGEGVFLWNVAKNDGRDEGKGRTSAWKPLTNFR